MSSVRSTRLIVAIFAALAMTVFVNARAAFSQDADSGTSVDPSWERTGPAIDGDAESADKVLEIPQAPCTKDGVSVACADTNPAGSDDDNDQAINAPSPGAPPPTLDEDTASSAAPDDQDWGTVDDYQNQPAYGVPYAVYPYPTTVAGRMNGPSQLPASALAPMSSPITQAARPPLNPGPWMLSPSMSTFSRPAGSPMMMSFGPHH